VLSAHFNYAILPSLTALAVLVGVFRSILRRESSDQLNLWLVGWVLVLMHFAAQFMDVGDGVQHRIWDAVSLDTLALAGIAFLISVSFQPHDRKHRAILALVLGLPALTYLNAVLSAVSGHPLYFALILIGCGSLAVLVWSYYQRASVFVVTLLLAIGGIAVFLSWLVERGTPALATEYILSAIYIFVAVFYWRNRRRATAGVFTTTLGFVAWGAVFPLGLFFEWKMPAVKIESEVWNLPKYFVAVGMILTLLEEQVEKNEHLAYHDALTGLPNRRLLADRLDQALAVAHRTNTKVAVLVLDLDSFKGVNDSLGHRVGDLLLKRIVERLSSRLRAVDTLARSGGDEFTIISEVSDPYGAESLANALVTVLHEPFQIEEHSLTSGVSVGVALFPDNAKQPDDLRAAADIAMYEAKRAGRNRYVLSEGAHVA
jgi:diguanylate cyclase (GGDEF)-like protein